MTRSNTDSAPTVGLAWSLESYFPGPDSEQFHSFIERLDVELSSLSNKLEDGLTHVPDIADALLSHEAICAKLQHLWSYSYCIRGEMPGPASQRTFEIHLRLDGVSKEIGMKMSAALRALDDASFSSLMDHAELAEVQEHLRTMRGGPASHLSAEATRLADELAVDGLYAWSKLAQDILGQITLSVENADGSCQSVPFAKRYDAFWSHDAHLRHASYAAYRGALREQETVLSAALNGIVGARSTLMRWRGADPLEDAARRMRIKPATIKTMIDVLYAGRGPLLSYLECKRANLGQSVLEMPDRWAPVGEFLEVEPAHLIDHVVKALACSNPQVADAVRRFGASRWIDVRPGPDRPALPFCVDSPLNGEPRVMLTNAGGLTSQVIAAHELGHAFHFDAMGKLRPWLRDSPLPLMETASTVNEHLFRAGLEKTSSNPAEQLAVMGASLDAAVNYFLRTPRDFETELAIYRERASGPLDADGLRRICRASHDRWFGDVFAPDGDEYAWVMMLGFPAYSDFFNFPYTFGYGLSLHIADELESGGEAAFARYRRFLTMTGSAPVEDCVEHALGYDVTSPDFWQEAIVKLTRRVVLFRELSTTGAAA